MSTVRTGRRRRRVIASTVTAGVALGVSAVAWAGISAWQAKGELEAVAPLGDTLVSALSSGDVSSATESLRGLREHANRARDLSKGPVWSAAERIPWIGAHFVAIRTVSAELALVGSEALPPLIHTAQRLGAAGDLSDIDAAQDPLRRAADVFADAQGRVEAVDTARLASPVADEVDRFADILAEGAELVDALARSSIIVPDLLGQDGSRDLLVMLQNSAEVRTGGGITGAFVQMRAENGRLTLVREADSALFGSRGSPLIEVPESTTALYGDVVGRFVQNATMTSDFALSGELASAWWESRYGTSPDAVVAVDPLVLRALLAGTGPLALADGSTLSADDVVARLLEDPYRTLDPDAQTAFQRQVTAAVFSAVADDLDPATLARALAPVVAEGRVSVWSSVAEVQEAASGSVLGGTRSRLSTAGTDAFGVYFNDATGGKMDGYLSVSIAGGLAACADAAVSSSFVRITLANTAPADAPSWPLSVTGGGLWGTAVGDIGTLVSVAAPADGSPSGVWLEDGDPLSVAFAIDGGLPTMAARVNVSPGESETIEFRFTRPVDAGTPRIVHTPLLNDVPVGVAEKSNCPM
jgi:hypothetical protein